MMPFQDSEPEGMEAATPQGHALDSRPKGCYTPRADGGCTRKYVPEFIYNLSLIFYCCSLKIKGEYSQEMNCLTLCGDMNLSARKKASISTL